MIRVAVPSRIDFAGGWTDVPDFAGAEGGAVLNAAINLCAEGSADWTAYGLTLDLRLTVPPDSHLGTSSSTNLAWIELIDGLTGRERTATERAELAWRVEQLMGEKGGKQDHYAAALGGFNLLRFGGADDAAGVEPVEPADGLAARLVLCDAGPSQGSGAQHEQVWDRYRQEDQGVRDRLRAIRDTVEPARDALVAGDWPALGSLMTRNRRLSRELAEVNNPKLDALIDAGDAAGALGAKPCGAGGGGFVLFLCEEERWPAVGRALIAAGGSLRPFGFAPRRD